MQPAADSTMHALTATERVHRALSWMRAHVVRTILLAIGLAVVLEYLSLPDTSLTALRKQRPGRTALMEQRIDEAEAAGKPYTIRQTWVPIGDIAPDLLHAVIVAEDGTFYQHAGVDWYEVEESMEKNIEKGGAARGASTITQQLSKNLFLSTSKDPLRKLKELILALRLERTLSKRRILEIYLNVIEWGPGIFGVEAAARRYFGKDASELTRDECLRLAAVIPSPLRHSPVDESRFVSRRSAIIEQRMLARGF